MALIECPDCGKEVSSFAEACPNCGYPSKYFPGKVLRAGDSYMFGSWGGEDIEWRVLDVEGRRALLITERAIDCRPYNDVRRNTTWADCSLRTWLNGEFLHGAFTDSQQGRLVEAAVANRDNPGYGTPGGPDTEDRIFCLSFEEARRYFDGDDSRICYPTQCARWYGVWTSDNAACLWWLRSPGDDQDYAADVYYDGYVDENGDWVDLDSVGVRPALWLDL